MEQPSVTIKNIKKFRGLYIGAVRGKKKTFIFEGQEVLVDYAKYVIEYFDKIKL